MSTTKSARERRHGSVNPVPRTRLVLSRPALDTVDKLDSICAGVKYKSVYMVCFSSQLSLHRCGDGRPAPWWARELSSRACRLPAHVAICGVWAMARHVRL